MYDVNLNKDNLEQLFEKSEGVNPTILAYLSQAAVFCLQKQGHNSPKEGAVEGDWSGLMSISWNQGNQKKLTKNWVGNDATECGAIIIALSLVACKNYRVLEKVPVSSSTEPTGFDYWLEDANPNRTPGLKNKVRLEVSGIMKGSESDINRRTRDKIKQVQVSDYRGYGAIILIVEFSNPEARVCQKS